MIPPMNSPRRISLIIALVLVAILFVGCGQVTPTVSPISTHTALPVITITTTPAPHVQDIAGLVYRIDNELWMISEDGNPRLLFNLPQDAFTFDLRFAENNVKIIYEHQGDIWIVDSVTQEQQNITNTPDRIEKAPQFWIGRLNVVLFESLPLTELSALRLPGDRGVPTIVNLDGSNYKIIDETEYGNFLLSANGKKLMYQLSPDLIAMYDWENNNTEVVDINQYELPPGREEGIIIQTWSPDERYLAGWIKGYLSYSEKYQFGVGIIDLKAKTSQPLHLISPIAGSHIARYFSWSSDGEWVAFTMHADPAYPDEFISLWVSKANGTEEVHIGEGVNPIWHEDGRRLVYDRKAKALIDGIWIYDLETNFRYKTSLPNDAVLIGLYRK